MQRPVRRLLLAAGATVLTVAGSAQAQQFGFSDNSVGIGQATPTQSADLAAGAGATVARTVFSWRDLERTPGRLSLGRWDAIYNADLARGIHPILVLMNAPRWAIPDGYTCAPTEDCRYPPDPSHDDDWRAIVATIADRYPDLAALEIWNEPNLRTGWQSPIDPARYADLVMQASAAAHEVNPHLPVLAAMGATYEGSDPSVGMAYMSFLRALYDAGIKGHIDGLSVHAYPRDIDLWRVYKILTEVREIRDDSDDAATPIWITETGASTTDYVNPLYRFGLDDQAVILKAVISRLRAMPDIASTVVHTLLNPTTFAANSPERGFGVMRPDFSPKPAYCVLAAMNASGYTCPAGVTANPSAPEIQRRRWQAQDLVQAAADAAREYRRRMGSYSGMNTILLHLINPDINVVPATRADVPGPSADPSRIFVSTWRNDLGEHMMVCNASRADRSYCIKHDVQTRWIYGKAEGSIDAAATAIVNGYTQTW